MCFIVFYCFLSAEMPENDQKWPETAKNDDESLQKFAKVYESQHSLQMEWKKVKLVKFIARQRNLRASLEHRWVTHGLQRKAAHLQCDVAHTHFVSWILAKQRFSRQNMQFCHLKEHGECEIC